jgi:hypothetical protein
MKGSNKRGTGMIFRQKSLVLRQCTDSYPLLLPRTGIVLQQRVSRGDPLPMWTLRGISGRKELGIVSGLKSILYRRGRFKVFLSIIIWPLSRN